MVIHIPEGIDHQKLRGDRRRSSAVDHRRLQPLIWREGDERHLQLEGQSRPQQQEDIERGLALHQRPETASKKVLTFFSKGVNKANP